MMREIRQSVRSLVRSPLLSLLAVVILTLGIGANSTVFTLVSRLLFAPPEGVGGPQRLVRAIRFSKERPAEWWSHPDFLYFRDGSRGVAELAAYSPVPLILTAAPGEQPMRVTATLVSANYFSVLAVRPVEGRGFLAEEGAIPGERAVAVLSSPFSQRAFGSPAKAVGSVLRLNGHPFLVVGVAPPEFTGLSPVEPAPDVWLPLTVRPTLLPQSGPEWLARAPGKEVTWLQVLGRLKPGVAFSTAQARTAQLAAESLREHPASARQGRGARLSPSFHLRPETRAQLGRLARLLTGVVALVLLIASTNVAILLLARAAARRKDFGVRIALGAHRGQIARQLVLEGLALAAVGGVGGLLSAYWTAQLAAGLLPYELAARFEPDLRVLGLTLAVAVAAALVAAAAPAVRAARTDTAALIKSGDPGSGRSRLLGTLVVVQIATSIVLVTGAALFLRSLRAAEKVDLGFEPRGRLLISVDLAQHGYDHEAFVRFVDRAVDRLSGLTGSRRVSTSLFVPFGGMWGGNVESSAGATVGASLDAVGPGYFEVMGIPLLGGDGFKRGEGSRVAVVNQAAADKLWPGVSPLGQTLRLDGGSPMTVVALARNAKYHELGEAPVPRLYVPTWQAEQREVVFLIEASGNPRSLAGAAERAIQALDPQVAVASVETLEDAVERVLGRLRSGAALVSLFSALAVALATAGLYGVMSYVVEQRRRAIGVEMALGATAGRVVGSVLLRGLRLTAIGSGIGLAVAWIGSRLLAGFLFGIGPRDPVSFLTVPFVLAAAALLACWLPARRAARIDPIQVLR